MKDKVKTKEQLIAELVEMRQRVAELEVAETERKRAEEALKKQQEELQTILDSIPAMVFYKDQKNRVVGVNDAYARFIGLAKQDIVGTSAFDLTPNRELAEAYWRDDQEVIESGTPKRNIIEPLITDETRWFQTDKIPRRDKDGQVIGVIGFSTEITERKRAEDALRESEKRFRDLFESAPDAVFVQDFDGYVLDVNPAACRLHGIEREYLIGRNVTELVPLDKREEAARKSLQLARGDRDYIESFSWTEDGCAVPVEIRGSRIDYSGEQAVLLHVRDITARKRAEHEIKERQMYLEAVLGAAPDAIVTLDAHRRIVEWNPGAERLFGYSRQEMMGQNLDHLITNPDTLEEAAGLTQIIMGGKDVPPTETVRYHKDGSPVNVTVAGSPILAGDELIGVVAVYTDITARKRVEGALRESEEKYSSLINDAVDSLSSGIFILDRDFKVVWINRAIEEFFGIEKDTIIGCDKRKTIKERIKHFFADPERFERIVLRSYDDNSCVENFECHVLPLGDRKERFLLHWSTPIRTGTFAGGRIEHYYDITERKRVEEALRQRNRELTMINRVGRTLGSTLDLDQILATVLEEVCRLLDVVAGSVWLKDAQGDLVCRQVIGPQSEIVRGWRLAPGEGLAGWVALSGESLIVPDVRADERHFGAVDQQTGLSLRSILSLPLRIKQDVIGVIQVVDTEIERFSPADLTLLEPLAMTAAAAIENARLYEQAQRDAEVRATLLREVNHRVKNNLTAVMGILALEMQRPHREIADLQTILRDLQYRVRGLVTVHELLSAAQWSPLPLDRLVTEVIQAVLNSSPIRHKIEVSVKSAAESLSITPNQATGLALVVNELTTNSIKHAFSGRSQGHIDVQITTGQDDWDVTLRFHDDGPGWPDDVLRGTRENTGLNIIRMTVRSPLRGQLALSNDGGAAATIIFRLAQTDL